MTTATITGYHAGYVVAVGVDSVEVASNGTVGGGGIYAKNSLTLNNDGLIAAVGDTHGIQLESNAVITNHGVMSGWDTIVEYTSGTVVHLSNYGLISSAKGEAVDLGDSSGFIMNASGALIIGHYGAVIGSGSIHNLGAITPTGMGPASARAASSTAVPRIRPP
jgi:hypothetical protein